MAEALFRSRLASTRPELSALTVVHSAGTSAIGGNLATSTAVQAMDLWGVDLASHRATELTPAMLLEADLVLAMAREHLVGVGRMEPRAMRWSTTYKHLAAACGLVVSRLGDEPVGGEERARSRIADVCELLREASPGEGFAADIYSRGSDIIDPIGGSLQVYLGVAEDIESSLDDVLRALFGRPPSSGRG